jgi:hypothetical protein
MLFLLNFIILTFSLYFLSRYNQIDKHFQYEILEQIINGKLKCNHLLECEETLHDKQITYKKTINSF